jgi:hypothetical protein
MTDVTRYTDTTADRPDLLDPATDSWVASVADVVKLAGYICDTAFVPNGFRGNAPATAAAILYGREIGVAPLTALSTLHVINGRVGMAAELMRARVLAAGHELEVTESTAAVCRMRGRRRGSQTWTEVTWSKGDAQQAGLSGDGWRKYPRAMLTARASAELCRLVFPDVTHGMAALEELDGAGPTPSEGSTPSTPKLVSRRRGQGTAPPPGEGEDPPPPPVDPQSPGPGEVATNPRASATPPPAGVETDTGGPDTPSPDMSHPAGGPVAAPPPPPPGDTVRSLVAPVVVANPGVAPPPPLPGEGMDAPEDDPRAQAALRGDEPATQPQIRHVMVLLRRLGVGSERAERIRIAQALIQRRVESFAQVTITEMGHVITTLLLAVESADPGQYLRWLVDEGHVMLADREAQAESGEPPELELVAEEMGVGDE